MNILILGSGGREHALAWKIAQSSRVDRVFVAPGNGGTAEDAENVDLPANDFSRITKFALENRVGLTVVGPEQPLVDGIVDALSEAGLRVFGPSKLAARLEGSKAFCKKLLHQANVPTAECHVFRNAENATKFVVDRYPIEGQEVPLVVKADGLAAGKGVIVCNRRPEVLEAIDRIAIQREFGEAGNEILIEERLDGVEVSILAITDGRTILTLPASQDHKRAHDGDAGPNTGGMGAFCPAPMIDQEVLQQIQEQILVPTVHAMKRGKFGFRGVLYAGLMLTNQGPKVLEYNVRFGDPECQPTLMRLRSDLVDVLEATVEGRLDELDELDWDPRASVCVVMASGGYPGNYERGQVIRGLDKAAETPDVKVFHAGTATVDGQVVANGGRVLGITALGNSVSAAKLQAYTAVKEIRWDGAWCRKDISDKVIKWEAT